MVTPWCALDDVKERLAGVGTRVPADYDTAISGVIIPGVSSRLDNEIAHVRGIIASPYDVIASGTASARRYTGGIPRLLLIDDCVELDSVTEDGQALVAGTDYDVWPLNDAPITGIMRLHGGWSRKYGAVVPIAKWGTFTALPVDLQDDAVSECVEVYLSARVAKNDPINQDAFGRIIQTKALLAKTYRDIHLYAYGAGFLR